MAEILVSLTGFGTLSGPDLACLSALQPCSVLVPVLCIGHFQTGKSSLLTHFLPLAEQQNQPFRHKSNGVFIYPKPVSVGNHSIALLKASFDFTGENIEEKEAICKAIYAVMAISAGVIVCAEGDEGYNTLETVLHVRANLHSEMGLGGGKIMVVTSEEGSLFRRFNRLMERENVGLVRRARDLEDGSWISEVEFLVRNLDFTTNLSCISNVTRAKTAFQAIFSLLKYMLQLANCPLSYPHFISKSGLWTTFPESLHSLQLKIEKSSRVKSAVPQPLFVRYFDSFAVNEILYQQLSREYEFSVPTVILTILGSPNTGKTTLLNCIAKTACERDDLNDVFAMGRSSGCCVLSHPIPVSAGQLMLVDMEGVGGCESRDMQSVQGLLVSAVLALASVPCIIFTNDVESVKFVERTVEKISYWNQLLGFSTERICLFFHDKMPSNEDQNPLIVELINRLNSQYFGGLEVIKVYNKPNFAISELKAVCEQFTSTVLSECATPKRNYSGTFVNLGNLIDSLRYVSKYHKKSLINLHIDDQHKFQASFFLTSRKTELDAIYHKIRSNGENNSHLELIFNEKFRENIGFFDCEQAVDLVKDYVNMEIVNTVNSYRLRLAQIENCHRFTMHLSSEELIVLLEQVLDYLYREAWVITTFMSRSGELKGKLEEMVERYPEDEEKMKTVLSAFGKKQDNLRNWFIANYTIQAAATVATGGLGAAANGTRAAVTAARLGYAAAAGGAAIFVRTAYGISTTLALSEKAFPLFTFSKELPGGLFAKAKRIFSTGIDKVALNDGFVKRIETIDGSRGMAVMLVIAERKTGAERVLNELVYCVSPFTCSNSTAFTDSHSSQCLFFTYYQHTITRANQPPCHGVIIFLRAPKKRDSKKFRMMVKIAASLLPNVSTGMLHIHEESQFMKAVLDSLHSTATVQMRSLKLPKISAYVGGSNRVRLYHELEERLERCGCRYDLRAISELNGEEVKNAVVSLKRDLDQSSLLQKEDFEQQLLTTVGQTNAID